MKEKAKLFMLGHCQLKVLWVRNEAGWDEEHFADKIK
jgi:hypothetical protein